MERVPGAQMQNSKKYSKFYQVGHMTVQVTSELPILENTFEPKV